MALVPLMHWLRGVDAVGRVEGAHEGRNQVIIRAGYGRYQGGPTVVPRSALGAGLDG